ncbi:enoyl-CoA hydratase-related protein [Salinisphaera aquimarina]|uniref:Enoyl-CoA hydratase-related protein n=1 Tax=Salinisphaera aquimarina TaxID=2094031 RepID=A0ABV7EVC1_9GAMM
MALPDTRYLQLDLRDGVLHATLNRPDAFNALNAGLIDDLVSTFGAIRDDHAVRVVVISGSGKHFCVGADLHEVGQMNTDDAERATTIQHNRRFGEVLQAIDAAPQAVVVLASGAALGGGFGLLCVADVTIVTADARMGMPETRLGLPAAQILPFVIERIGKAEARRLGICGIQFDGAEAKRLGVAHHVVADSDAGEAVLAEVLTQILACAPGANAVTKEVIRSHDPAHIAQQLDTSAALFTDCLYGAEGQEGTHAFLEKRAPSWAQR